MIEQAREDASRILDGDIKEYPLLEAELAQIQADAAAEFIDKA
jgi:ATP-dependent DNA helicase RecG